MYLSMCLPVHAKSEKLQSRAIFKFFWMKKPPITWKLLVRFWQNFARIIVRVARLSEKYSLGYFWQLFVPVNLALALWSLLLFGLLSETLSDLRWLFAGNMFCPKVVKSQSIQMKYYANYHNLNIILCY